MVLANTKVSLDSRPGRRVKDASFGKAEFDRLTVSDEVLAALCHRSARMFLQRREDAAPVIAALLKSHLIKRTPVSLLRVGDGEGNVLGLTRGTIHPDQLNAFNAKFRSQIGMTLRENEAQVLCEKVREALCSANCLGFRLDSAKSENEVISGHLADGQIGAALGVLYARTFLHEELLSGRFSDKVITSMWVHYALIPYVRDIMDAAPAVIVITGRAQLEPHFESRLGKRLRSFIAVPPQGYRPATEGDTHYRNAFPRVLDALRADLQGTLVLVGAGFLGKLYCDAAKNNGAVALDFGAAFDILAGISTRPVHSRLNINALRWT
jgi:hypothetical protein